MYLINCIQCLFPAATSNAPSLHISKHMAHLTYTNQLVKTFYGQMHIRKGNLRQDKSLCATMWLQFRGPSDCPYNSRLFHLQNKTTNIHKKMYLEVTIFFEICQIHSSPMDVPKFHFFRNFEVCFLMNFHPIQYLWHFRQSHTCHFWIS